MIRSILLGLVIVVCAVAGVAGYLAFDFLTVAPERPGHARAVRRIQGRPTGQPGDDVDIEPVGGDDAGDGGNVLGV